MKNLPGLMLVSGIVAATLSAAAPSQAADRFMWRGAPAVLKADDGIQNPPGGGIGDPSTPTQPTNPDKLIDDQTFYVGHYISYVGPKVLPPLPYDAKYTNLPLFFIDHPDGAYFRGSLINQQPGSYDVNFQLDGKSSSFKITLKEPAEVLQALPEPLTIYRNEMYKKPLAVPLSGKWVAYKLNIGPGDLNDAMNTTPSGSMDSFAEYEYKFSGLPGNLKWVYDMDTRSYNIEGYTGNTSGAFTATVEVTEKVWAYEPIESRNVKGYIQYVAPARTIRTHVSTATFPVTVVDR